jgi:hypothetical protein
MEQRVVGRADDGHVERRRIEAPGAGFSGGQVELRNQAQRVRIGAHARYIRPAAAVKSLFRADAGAA